MTIQSANYIRSDLGYPSPLAVGNESLAREAKKALFDLPNVQKLLQEQSFNLQQTLAHTFFVQPCGSEEIFIHFKEKAHSDKVAIAQISPQDPVYQLIFAAMTGFQQGQEPPDRQPAQPTPPQPPAAKEIGRATRLNS